MGFAMQDLKIQMCLNSPHSTSFISLEELLSKRESLRFALQVSSKDEDFLDLSVDVEQNTSITHCLR